MNTADFLALAGPLPEPMFLVGDAFEVRAANPAALKFLDASAEQIAGRPLADLVAAPGDQVADFVHSGNRTTRFVVGRFVWCTGQQRISCRTEAARMAPGLTMVRLQPHDPSVRRFHTLNQHIASLNSEIQQRRRAEEEVRRGQQLLESFLENSTALMYIKDSAGRYVLVNRRFEELVRRSPLGLTDRDLFPAETAETLRANDGAVLAAGKAIEFEEETPHTEGPRLYLSVKFPLFDQQSASWGVGGISTDITERKRLGEQLRQTQRLESLGVLAGGVAHDFNNLLTGIMGNASLALDILPADHPAYNPIRDVVEASDRASHLTRQMLAYAGKGRFITEPLDLSDLVRDIARLIQISIPKKVRLDLRLAADLPRVDADPGQIQQLAMNLIINGAEAIGEDDVGTVHVATASVQADEDYLRARFPGCGLSPGCHVSLEVADTGIGMDPDTRARIFDPFFTTKFTGRGLGLAAVLGIVRGHKGAIGVESTPGEGSTFRVLLPAMRVAEVPPSPGPPADLRGWGTVLVVDDEETVRQTARNMLERYGYTVVTAENGQQAVDTFRDMHDGIRVVLLDLTMPVMSGEEAFRRIHALRPGIPVLLSSGYNEVEAVRRFTNQRVAGFIQKPYTAVKLAEKVKAVLVGG